MTNENNLDYISALSELDEKLTAMKRKVKHGKLKIQRKKIKAQVMKKHKPTDYDRENICKNARKKAHSVVADTRRNISNGVREGLTVVNPTSFTLSERYDLDFMEEALGYDVELNFFDKPEITYVTEGLTVGTTKTGRPRKCKAIGVAEGCFAPISTPEGERVFSRNKRLYEEDHWECQFENQNLLDRVNTRRMLGTIGHYDKKVDDEDLAKGFVSHIVTNLEIREDDKHGRYLWGRLEIINTEAGRRLKEYYDMGIPLYVSSRGGGKLIDVPGKDYKIVDKYKYYCETFDVVKEPGFLEAQPEYLSESKEDVMNELEALLRGIAEKTGFKVDEANLEAFKNTLCECKDAELDGDNNMAKVNVDVTAEDSMETVVKKVLQPMQDEVQKIVKPLAESIAKLTATVEQIRSDIYEDEETPAEEAQSVSEEDSAENNAEVAESTNESEEPKAEEDVAEVPVEEVAPAVEELAEGKEDKKEDEKPKEEPHGKDCTCAKCKKGEKADECGDQVANECNEEAPEEGAGAPADIELAPESKQEVAEATEEPKVEDKPEGEEKVEEQWAHVDPKETTSPKAEHEAPQGKPETPLKGDVYANEPTPATIMKDAKEAPQEADPTNKETEPAVNGAILEEETEAPDGDVGEQQVVDYQAAYEEMKSEVDDATRLIEETTQMFEEFGKRHREVIAESKESTKVLEERVQSLEIELNSYKISEKFDVSIEEAKEMLSSKSYEKVEEELKESEAKKLEDEAQAKANEVSESVKETTTAKAPVSREVYSAFAKSESISESNESGRARFSWFKK